MTANGDSVSGNASDISLPKKVAIVYSDVKREYFKNEEDFITEDGADIYAGDVAKYVSKLGIEVETFACDTKISNKLQKYEPDMALNLVDSIRGQSFLGSSAPGLFETLHIPYTGAGVLGWSLGTNKFVMYELMQSAGIPVPSHQLVSSASEMIDPALRYPLFPKLNIEHSSIGIDENSICENERELRAKLKDLITKHDQPVLIDEFIAGIEVTAAVLDGLNTKVYSVQRHSR
jgi:D-alanine-D-alanine ligase